jgi:aspartyl-tRNA(Asn)/glutamyl-tRNA(Gln) amidotransferase subunit C
LTKRFKINYRKKGKAMSLTLDDVAYVAGLARLEFTEEEQKDLAVQLNNVLDYAEKLNELDTTDVAPTEHAIPIKNVFRKDEVKPSLDREVALSNAPESEMGCFKVPNVIE